MTMKHDTLTLPPGCIRGPELYDTAQIAAELRAADYATLAAYTAGVALLGRAHALLAAEARLTEARRTRDFLIAQLVTLEARDTAQFDAALASYRHTSCGEEPAWHPPLAPSAPD
jgi:hypothetical protein